MSLSNSKNKIASEGENNKIMTKYILKFDIELYPHDIKSNNFYEKISLTGFVKSE